MSILFIGYLFTAQYKHLLLHHPLKIHFSTAEINQQADFHIVGLEVINGLGKMYIVELNNRFYFYHDQFLDKEIHTTCTDIITFIAQWHLFLSFETDTLQTQLYSQGTLIHYFLKCEAFTNSII